MIATLLLIACATTPQPQPQPQRSAAEELGTFPTEVVLVRPLDLAKRISEAGAPKVVNFWATWCGPCREEHPRLQEFATANTDIDMVWVSLDLASLRDSKVAPYLATGGYRGITQLQLDDPDPAMAIAKVLPTWPDMVPVTLVVSSEGQVLHTFAGGIGDEELVAIRGML